MSKHDTVLLLEAVDALVHDPDGLYVDGTYGRGGHSALILERLSEHGRLIAFDKDLDAIANAESQFVADPRFSIVHDSFAALNQYVPERGLSGMLMDLGVSSPQLDEGDRGFSFMKDGPLDMRMDTSSGESAADWLARVSIADLTKVLKEYGEERFAKRIATAIVEAGAETPLTTTAQLSKIVTEANPAWERHKHPATRAFQAIRIYINRELADLEQVLPLSLESLQPDGRLVVISFHSLEDRIVKRFMKRESQGPKLPKNLPVTADMQQGRVTLVSKAVKASENEVEQNVRSRSAIMRIAKRLDHDYRGYDHCLRGLNS